MKRSPLQRRRPLRRSRPVAVSPRLADPERAAWKQVRYGRCENCGELSNWPLHGHHCLARQKLALLGLSQFDSRNRMDLCDRCHFEHEFGQENRKIPVERIPERALAYMVDMLGEAGAADYSKRHYGCEESS